MMRDSTTRSTRVRKDGAMMTPSTRVTKEVTTPAPAQPEPTPAPAPTPAPVVDSSMMTRSTTVDSSVSSTTTTTTSTSVVTSESMAQPPMTRSTRFGNGFYVGVHGGANFPQGDINSFYETGTNVGGQLGWDPQNGPIGLRLNVSWNRLNGRDLSGQTIGNVRYEADLQNADLYSAFADAKLRLPFGRFLGATSGLYVVGGGGVTYFNNYSDFGNTTGTTAGGNTIRAFDAEDRVRPALNAGGGVSWGIGNVSLFVEGRYARVFTKNRDTDYVPVTIGLTFH